MSADLALSLPVVQMGHVEKLVEMSQNQPQAQQLAAQQTIVRELKNQDQRIAETQKTESQRVREREEQESGGDSAQRDCSQEQRREETPAEQEAEGKAPWAGHLVDVRV
ncbi:MAG: hypothetical protein LBJ82_04030 [Deltaproteobacteria bacterium]|jgi:hypothetical protein|nr:hypothetical protein [Deltaproteobacteria bacterium]